MKNRIVSVLVLSSVGVFAIAGCAADAASTSADEEKPTVAETENIAQTEAALTRGGGLSFSCGALGCICHGDFDCDNLFSGEACGSWPAKCYDRGPSQYCICAPWVRNAAAGRAAAGAGAAKTGVIAQ